MKGTTTLGEYIDLVRGQIFERIEQKLIVLPVRFFFLFKHSCLDNSNAKVLNSGKILSTVFNFLIMDKISFFRGISSILYFVIFHFY